MGTGHGDVAVRGVDASMRVSRAGLAKLGRAEVTNVNRVEVFGARGGELIDEG